jgi:hypothetical protein
MHAGKHTLDSSRKISSVIDLAQTSHPVNEDTTEVAALTDINKPEANPLSTEWEAVLMPALFSAFDLEEQHFITFQTWCLTLARILRGTNKEKLEFCYRVWLDKDGKLTQRGLLPFKKCPLLSVLFSVEIRNIENALVRKFVADDGKMELNFYEYCAAVSNIPRVTLLLDQHILLSPPVVPKTPQPPTGPPLSPPRFSRRASIVSGAGK